MNIKNSQNIFILESQMKKLHLTLDRLDVDLRWFSINNEKHLPKYAELYKEREEFEVELRDVLDDLREAQKLTWNYSN
jgi:hypothetical protein